MKDYSKDYSYMPDKYLTDETSYQEKYSKFDLKKVASSRIPKECEKEPNNKNQEWIYGRYFKLHVSINNFQNLDIELVSKLLQALVDDERITEFKLAQQVDKGRFADNDQITVYLNNFLSLADIQEIASAIRDKIKELEIPDNEQCLGEKDVFSLNNYVSARCDTNFINGDYGVYHFFDHEIRKYYEKNNDSNLTLKAIKFVFLNMLLRDDIEINAEELSEQDSHKVQEQFALADDPMQNDKYIVGGFMPEGLWELAFDKLKVYQETTQNRIVERNEKEQLDVLNTMKEVFIGSKESTTENLVNVSMFQPAPKETNNNNNSISLTQ